MTFEGAVCTKYVSNGLTNYWLSRDEDDQEFARQLCATCPVQVQCEARVEAIKPSCGVWSGRTVGTYVEEEQNVPARVG